MQIFERGKVKFLYIYRDIEGFFGKKYRMLFLSFGTIVSMTIDETGIQCRGNGRRSGMQSNALSERARIGQ